MDRKIKKLLAELALIAAGHHQHAEAECIATALDGDVNFIELVATIRALSLMNAGQYQAALVLLEPLAIEHEHLICFTVMCASALGLGAKLDFWLQQGSQSTLKNIQTFAMNYQVA